MDGHDGLTLGRIADLLDDGGRAGGLREAWEILVRVSHNGGSLAEALQAVHWRMKEAEADAAE